MILKRKRPQWDLSLQCRVLTKTVVVCRIETGIAPLTKQLGGVSYPSFKGFRAEKH